MTSYSETVYRQSLRAGNTAKCITSERFIFYKFVQEKVFLRGLYNKSLKRWSGGKQLILFLSNLNVSLGPASGNIEILGKEN